MTPILIHRLFFILFIYFIIVVCAFYIIEIKKWEDIRPTVKCFSYETGMNSLLELDETECPLGSGIFFHETSCPKGFTDVKLDFRQACSIESALLAHPKNDVFLLIPSPVKVTLNQIQNPLVMELLKYPNFKIRHINFDRYLSNTPMHNLHQTGALLTSVYPMRHASDVLRFATLYKFGGVYLDLDMIVLKPLTNMSNYAGIETKSFVGASIINFGNDRVGREMAVECAKELSRTYNGRKWSYNSLGVLTRVLERRCNASSSYEMTKEKCKGFHVYTPTSFYPVHYRDVKIIFQDGKTELIKSRIAKSYTIHVWNMKSAKFHSKGEDNPYLNLAKIYCPKIFATNKEDDSVQDNEDY